MTLGRYRRLLILGLGLPTGAVAVFLFSEWSQSSSTQFTRLRITIVQHPAPAALDQVSAGDLLGAIAYATEDRGVQALRVEHSIHQALNLEGRLTMLHRGQATNNFRRAEQHRLSVDELFSRLEEVRRSDLLDQAEVNMLRGRNV